MKQILALFMLVFLTGCFRSSCTVTVGQNPIRTPNMISCYSFYSHELIKYYDALPADAKLGIVSVSRISDNQLKFAFDSKSKLTNDSSVAALFEGFCLNQYRKRFIQWEEQKEELMRPFLELAETKPEIFKKRAAEMMIMKEAPIVEVYALRIE